MDYSFSLGKQREVVLKTEECMSDENTRKEMQSPGKTSIVGIKQCEATQTKTNTMSIPWKHQMNEVNNNRFKFG
jgi:hypothetical protein